MLKCSICGPPLHEGWLRSIMDEVKYVITNSSSRKQELLERAKFEDFDDEEAELLENERGIERTIFIYVCRILQTLIEASKNAFLPYLDELLSDFSLDVLVKENTISFERFGAICIFTDLVADCPEAAGKYYELYFPSILGVNDDEDPQVREIAFFGIQLRAEYGHSSYKHFVVEALSKINKVIMHSNAREPKNEGAHDNAVSALGMICEFHGESIDLAQAIEVRLEL